MDTSDFRNGLRIEISGDPYAILFFQHVKPGKGGAFVRTKIKNLRNGKIVEKTFRAGEKLTPADVEDRTMQYLYHDGDEYHFMDTATYDQVQLSTDTLGNAVQYLIPDSTLNLEWFEGNAIGVDLPPVVELKVIETPPGVKDATASAQRKPAKMETGLVVQVPAFIDEGEVIRVNTIDASYSERAK